MTNVAPAGAPVCYRHPGRVTYVRCARCDRPICPDCMNDAAVGHQCPECVAQGRRTQRPVRTVFGGSTAGSHGYVTISLIVVNGIMLLISMISARSVSALYGGGSGLDTLIGGQTPLMANTAVIGAVHQFGVTAPAGIASGQYYRLFTAMFMHYGLLHLAVNMYALWILGRQLEAVLGPLRFLALYLVAGIGGNVAAFVFTPYALSAGASTALYGLFGALIFVVRRLGGSLAPLIPVIVINFALTIAIPGISIAGHAGGFVVGAILGAALAYAPARSRVVVPATVFGGILVALAALVLAQTAALAG